MKTLYASGYARVCVRIGVLPPPSIGERFSKQRASTGYPVSWRWRRINLHSRGFQFTSTAANSNDNTGSSGYAGRWSAAWTSKASPRGERLGGARPAAAHANFWLQIKIVPRGGEACDEGSKNEKRAGRWYFVLENLNSNPAEHAPGHTRV